MWVDQASKNTWSRLVRLCVAARLDDSRSIRMQEIRPKSSPILGDVRVLAELCPVTMQSNGLTRGDSRAEFGPSLGETPFVHENEVESGLQRELVTMFRFEATHDNAGLHQQQILRLDRCGHDDGLLGCATSAQQLPILVRSTHNSSTSAGCESDVARPLQSNDPVQSASPRPRR
jgi:hypothetical protein